MQMHLKSCQNTDGAATKLTSKEAFKTPGMARCKKKEWYLRFVIKLASMLVIMVQSNCTTIHTHIPRATYCIESVDNDYTLSISCSFGIKYPITPCLSPSYCAALRWLCSEVHSQHWALSIWEMFHYSLGHSLRQSLHDQCGQNCVNLLNPARNMSSKKVEKLMSSQPRCQCK